tara:strand:+ start:966 stop:1160 length:195 start_codon:yes stop_codon:yes gene_type:complete
MGYYLQKPATHNPDITMFYGGTGETEMQLIWTNIFEDKLIYESKEEAEKILNKKSWENVTIVSD